MHGRSIERATIRRLLAQVRQGHSGVLVLLGEPGVGKSFLLEDALTDSDDLRVLRASGVDAESELAFATLHQLVRPVLDRLDRLPSRQAEALGAALGLAPAQPGERFLVAAGVLTLLSEAADDRPVLCVVDDLQWADQPSLAALGFAARRLEAEGVLMLLAVREEDSPLAALDGLPTLRITGLDSEAAAALLDERAGPNLAPWVRDWLATATNGNPLALIELAATLPPGQLAGREPLLEPLPVGAHLQGLFLERVRGLPDPARMLLLVAAAEESGELAVLFRASSTLGVPVEALESAEAAGLVRVVGQRVEFSHPLVRSAVYRQATFMRRRMVHRALADALDGEAHIDRWAWHRAAATVEPDEEVAAELERSAERARQRSGYGAAVAALQRASQLTSDDRDRARRLVAAAQMAAHAGQFDQAVMLLEQARPLPGETLTSATASHVRGMILASRDSLRPAATLILQGASRLADQDPVRAAAMMFEAARLDWIIGDWARSAAAFRRIASLGLPPDSGSEGTARVAAALGQFVEGDASGGHSLLAEGIAAVVSSGLAVEPLPQIVTAEIALGAGIDTAARELAESAVAECRAQGLLVLLPLGLTILANAELHGGRYARAVEYATEGLQLAREVGQHGLASYLNATLALAAAVQGRQEACRQAAGEALAFADASSYRRRMSAAIATWAIGLLNLGLGRADEALDQLERSTDVQQGHLTVALAATGDLVEAAVRVGKPERAQAAVERYAVWAQHTGQPVGQGVAARCRALLAWNGEDSEPNFNAALRLHQRSDRPFELARTELAFGQWLRRVRLQRNQARVHLQAALECFIRLGAIPWIEHARLELRASGGKVRDQRQTLALDLLTPQELQIARRAAENATNREIAAQLFLSPRTVGYHLHKVFAKLGITSRTELMRLNLEQLKQD